MQTKSSFPKAAILGFFFSLAFPLPANAWTYLEHSYLADRSCIEARRVLEKSLDANSSEDVVYRYMALNLVCPSQWEGSYCEDGHKGVRASLNDVKDTTELSLTLGDFAALPDHISQFGSIRGFPRASQMGLTSDTIQWLEPGYGSIKGEVGRVAKTACRTDPAVNWPQLEQDLEDLSTLDEAIPTEDLSPHRRGEIQQGPTDPTTAFSIINPHYLDLVLQNQHHFGAYAYSSWLGFHSTARELSQSTCEELLIPNKGIYKSLSKHGTKPWNELGGGRQQAAYCRLLEEAMQRRITDWLQEASSEERAILSKYIEGDAPSEAMVQRVTVNVLSLLFEGLGLHFLQDGLSGGHVRVDRAAHSLSIARYRHDEDSRNGVTTTVGTRTGSQTIVAFGDGYLLGDSKEAEGSDCAWKEIADNEERTACLLRNQRRLLVRTTAASLVDWSLGGSMYEPEIQCDTDAAQRFVCDNLPTRPPIATGLNTRGSEPQVIQYGTLPEPPPPYSYQSFSVNWAIDGSGKATQMGLNLRFLREMGSMAHWMQSWDFSLLSTSVADDSNDAVFQGAKLFHWRTSARFLVNMGPLLYGGFRGFGEDVTYFMGMGGYGGISALPEGWTKLPLEISLNHRFPLTMFDTRHGGFSPRSFQIEGYWIELSLGLAFL
jgi:hypothetical protein